MSLINEALKKAQKQRTGETPLSSMPAIGGESAMRIAQRRRPAGLNTLLLRLGIGGALLAIVIIGGTVLMRNKAPAARSAPIPETIVVKVPEPAPTAASPAAAPTTFVVPIVSTPQLAATPPTAAPAAGVLPSAPVPIVSSVEPAQPTVVATAPVPLPVTPKPAAAPGKLEPRAINFIESLRVVGIRASATDSKVLMNDRVYRIGSIIEHEMGIKLSAITSSSLTFEDEHGGTYTRTF